MNMQTIRLSKEKMIEILQDEENMQIYYDAAINDKVEAQNRCEIVLFLILLVRFYYKKLFVDSSFDLIDFFGMEKFNLDSEYWKFYELLRKTNLEIGLCVIHGEQIDDEILIGFCEIQAYTYFCFGNYISCLDVCKNALNKDNKNSVCNFIKALIIELCLINKTPPTYKIALTNYQKSLLDKCKATELNFGQDIFYEISKEIENRVNSLGAVSCNLMFTPVLEDFSKTKIYLSNWTEENQFYLCNNLFLNPLINFDRFAEASFEEFEDLPIHDDLKEYFISIVDDYKMCRGIAFLYYKSINNIGKREMSMAYSYVYSIFDKIAFLIAKVFGIDVEKKVDFSEGNLFCKGIYSTKQLFKNVKNNNIIPLYLIMKEVREKNNIKNALAIGTFEHNELRNKIEHKSIVMVDDKILRRNTLHLLYEARNAILHTFMLLHSYSKDAGDMVTAISMTFLNKMISDDKFFQKFTT